MRSVSGIEGSTSTVSVVRDDTIHGVHKCYSKFDLLSFYRRITLHYGVRFSTFLALVYVFVKGALLQVSIAVQLPFLKNLGYSAAMYQTLQIVTMTPWAMKGLIGALSDVVPIGGYFKRHYMSISSLGGFIASIALAVMPTTAFAAAPSLAPILLCVINAQVSTLDLLCEGKYAEIMRCKPESKVDIVTYVWACYTFGQLIAASFVGPFSDYIGWRTLFICMIPLSAIPVYPIFRGYLPETRYDTSKCCSFNVNKFRTHWVTFSFASFVAFGALGLGICGLLLSYKGQFIYAIILSCIVAATAFAALDKTTALCNLFMFIQDCSYIHIGGVLDYWYTAKPDCVANGPNFNYTYYQTYTQIVGICATAVGIIIYQKFLSRLKFRVVFWVTTFIRIIASVVDIIIVKRWNLKIGIPDKIFYIIGDAIVAPICKMLSSMPSIILTAKLCPKNMESTVYAILAGIANFGGAVSRSIGVYSAKLFGIDTKTPNCNFEWLPELIAVAHCAVPALCIPLTFWLIPDKYQIDRIISPKDCSDLKSTDPGAEVELIQVHNTACIPVHTNIPIHTTNTNIQT